MVHTETEGIRVISFVFRRDWISRTVIMTWRRARGGKQNHGRFDFKIETCGFLKGAFRIATGSSVVDPRRRDPLPSATSATARGLSEHTPQLLQQASLQHFHRGPSPLILRITEQQGTDVDGGT